MKKEIYGKIFRLMQLTGFALVCAVFNTLCIAQDKESERKPVNIKATVSPPPAGVTLAEALATFPESIDFEYNYNNRSFDSSSSSFTSSAPLYSSINLFLKENTGLKHTDSSIDATLFPYLVVGGVSMENTDSQIVWSEAGGFPKDIEFKIHSPEGGNPVIGEYAGEMVLLFEESSGD